MIVDLTEVVWLSEGHLVSYHELQQLSGLDDREIHLLVESGALTPQDPHTDQFDSALIDLLRRLSHLKQDFELDSNGMCLSLSLLQKIHSLERQLHVRR